MTASTVYRKRNQQKVVVYDSTVEIFNLSIQQQEITDDRFFQEPALLSDKSSFLVVIERKFAQGQALALTRVVVFDFQNSSQWCSAWDRWVDYTLQEFKEKTNQGMMDKVFNFLFKYQAVLKYKVKRQGYQTPPKEELVIFPIDSQKVSGFIEAPKLNLESDIEERKVTFDDSELVYIERGLITRMPWSSIDRIIFFKGYSEFLESSGIKLMGSTRLQIDIPSKNFNKLLEFLNKKYAISKEHFFSLLNDNRAQEVTLWTKHQKEKVFLNKNAKESFLHDEFKEGFKLMDGRLLSWSDLTLKKIQQNPLFIKSKLHEADGFMLKEKIQFGPLLISDLFIYKASFKGDDWIAESLRFDFDQLPETFDEGKLVPLFQPLVSRTSSWFHQQPFECMVFNDYITLNLSHSRSFWEGFVAPSFELFWSLMRDIHPETKFLTVSEKMTFDCSTSSVESATFSNKTSLKQIPSPVEVSKKPLTFWTDNKKNLHAISSYNTSFYWQPEMLKSIVHEQQTYPGERGMEDYVVDFVKVVFKNNSEFYFEFSGLKEFDAQKVLKFMGKVNTGL